jgi:hypothetical protein
MRPLFAGLALCLFAVLPSVAQDVPEDLSQDERTIEIFRYTCGNNLGRREITLFANGTVRLREGELGKEALGLFELKPEQLQGALHRIQELDLSEVEHRDKSVEGDWIDRCELLLQRPGESLRIYRFGRFDSLPLYLSSIVRVAEDLGGKVRNLKKTEEELPSNYEPRPGDVLKRSDGQLYRIITFTGDKRGVELEGVDTPITLIVLRDRMRREFVELVERPKR